MEDEELREIERQGGERVGDEEVRGRWKVERWERESEKEGKMTWTSVVKEIMTWRCLEEKFFFFSQLRVLIYNNNNNNNNNNNID